MNDLETKFPGLRNTNYKITSPYDISYNCIAWAANETSKWWWPSPYSYWPREVKKSLTIEVFCEAYGLLGFQLCDSFELGPHEEKVALFTKSDNIPTHAARQLLTGRWTSKLGKNVDIEHELHALEGDLYGNVHTILKRTIPHS